MQKTKAVSKREMKRRVAKRRRTMERKRHPNSRYQRNLRRYRRRVEESRESTTAIVKVEPPPPPVALVRAFTGVSMVPKVKQTVEDFERVRRFVTSCLNTDMQRWEAKNPYPEKGTRDQQHDWEEQRMRLQVDWGTIPGNPKPFLMQPGAEKFLFWLELRPEYVNHEAELGDGHLELASRVLFFHKRTKEKVFDGPDCSCTTMETNYRYVWVEKDDPCASTFSQGHDKSRCAGCQRKAELKAIKMGRSRKIAEWARGKKVGDRWIWEERVDNPNIHNERNKVRQMGGKRALVKGVRNMGAISEIFTADPSEWDLASEEPDDSPESEMDYTDSGRKIYVDGVSPSGRFVKHGGQMNTGTEKERQEAIEFFKSMGLWCEKHKLPVMKCPADEHTSAEHAAFEEAERKWIQSRESQKHQESVPGASWKAETERKADMPPKQSAASSSGQDGPSAGEPPVQTGAAVPKATPPPPMQFKGTVEINFVDCPDCPIVRGDIANITEALRERFPTFKWRNDWYHISLDEVPRLVEALAKNGYKADVKQPPKPKSSPAKKSPTPPPAEAKRSSGPNPDHKQGKPAAPVFVSGTIERVNNGMRGNSPTRDVTLIQAGGKKFNASCFHKSLFDDLTNGLGKLATFVIVKNGQYNNIERLVRIGGDEWDEQGKKIVPERREADAPTLFR